MRVLDRSRLSKALPWVAVVAHGLDSTLRMIDDGFQRTGIRIDRDGTRVRLWNNGIDDKVVTHLVSDIDAAVLPHPILLRNHQSLKTVELRGLPRRDPDGAPVPSPGRKDQIGVVIVDAAVQMR